MTLLQLLKMYAGSHSESHETIGGLPVHLANEIPSEWQDDFEEHAAILEYDGGLSTADAEAQAKREIINRIMNS